MFKKIIAITFLSLCLGFVGLTTLQANQCGACRQQYDNCTRTSISECMSAKSSGPKFWQKWKAKEKMASCVRRAEGDCYSKVYSNPKLPKCASCHP